jgi:translation initiation factor IF-2
MAKIRAYKLAEELGIDRAEFVEKAAELGIELKSAMAALEDDEVERLREKLGGPALRKGLVTEERVSAKGGAVIRRRRKAAPEPAPEPPRPAPVIAPPEPIAPASFEAEAPEPVVEPEPEPEPQPEPEPEAVPVSQPAAARSAAEASEGGPAGAGADRAGRQQRKLVREVVNLREQERLARQATRQQRRQVVLEPRQVSSPRRRRRDALQPARAAAARPPKESRRVVRVEGTVAVGELARMLGAKAPEVQRKLMALGTMVSINQSIDVETARKVAAEFGFEVQDVGFNEQALLEKTAVERDAANLVPRAPVVTVMGHVDHGKTSLLDAIRRTNVVAGEAGGITQHVGAYRVEVGGRELTFIDTPGHAAFTAMRARGAQVTDIVILVVAASEGVMPQTIEAIDHARAAGVPIVVAINKIDLPGANPQQTRRRLMEHGLVPETFGGDTICVDVSATKGTGIDQLLEMVSLQGEVLELKADAGVHAKGVVIEARLDKGRGPVATVLVQEGTLRRGDAVVAGAHWGRVRSLEDENGERMSEAGPSIPVQVIGLAGVPEAGQVLHAVESERVAKEIADHRLAEQRAKPAAESRAAISLEEFLQQGDGGVKELPLLIKADVHGSVEALREALLKLSTDAVKVNVLLSGVGAVSESDVMLAKASGAIVIAFHVRPDPAARRAAEEQGVDVRAYRIIYEAIEDVQKAMAGLLPPTVSEVFIGRAEVRDTFNVPRVGTVAGSYVAEGNIRRGARCRLLRDGVQLYDGRVGSLKRFKDDVREVASGFECGIGIEGYNDVKIGDVIEIYAIEEKPTAL